MGEHDRTLGLDRLVEHDAVDAVDEPRKPVAPLLERPLPKALAVEAEEIEGDEAGARPVGLGAQRCEVALPIGTEQMTLAGMDQIRMRRLPRGLRVSAQKKLRRL